VPYGSLSRMGATRLRAAKGHDLRANGNLWVRCEEIGSPERA
jgi:hypothetical protein